MNTETGSTDRGPGPHLDRRARFAQAMLAYLPALLASAVALWALPFILYPVLPHTQSATLPPHSSVAIITGIPFVIAITFLCALLFTFVPFVVFAALAVYFRLRNPLYYIACSIVMARIVGGLLHSQAAVVGVHDRTTLVDSVLRNWTLDPSAVIGGLVYWCLAVKWVERTDTDFRRGG